MEDRLISLKAAIDAVSDWLYDGDDKRSVDQLLSALPPAQPEPSTEVQEILDYLDNTLHPIVSPDVWYVYSELHDMVSKLPSAQPELIEKTAYIRGFEQGRTQGMIDAQGGKK